MDEGARGDRLEWGVEHVPMRSKSAVTPTAFGSGSEQRTVGQAVRCHALSLAPRVGGCWQGLHVLLSAHPLNHLIAHHHHPS